MNIYTRTGDLGMTSTLNGEKVSKGSLMMEVQGGIDEINSQTGYLRSLMSKYKDQTRMPQELSELNQELKEIQEILFRVGGHISSGFKYPYVTVQHVTDLENRIDKMLLKTGELHKFIYLSGHETAAYCHVLRSNTRRVERNFVRLIQNSGIRGKDIPIDYKYINRLADYYFQTARYLNVIFEVKEEIVSH